MSNLLEHAIQELRSAGYDPDSPEFVKSTVYRNVMELVEVFASQHHSKMSAGWILSLFQQVASFKPLGPLTGDTDEWVQVDVARDLWQNKRCSRVFREKGTAYDVEGVVFRSSDGASYTNQDSRRPIEFPYTPQTLYVEA